MVAVCAATTMAQGARTVAVNVLGPDGVATPDASIAILTMDGQMTPAAANGIVFAVKNVGQKVTIDATHSVYGSASLEAVLPAVGDPIFIEVQFTGRNQAFAVVFDVVPDLSAQQAVAEGVGCAGCEPIGEGTFVGNNSDFEGDITSCTFSDTMTAWYCYTAGCDGTATASTCGSGFDTALSAWDACGGSQLACNDDACGLQSTIAWSVSAGVTYFIRVSGFNNASGIFTLEVSCEGGGGGGCGNCNEPHDGVGCSDPACEALVCAADSFCCDVGWDAICADLAEMLCDCGGPPPPPGCEIECPAGALEEGEPCGDDTNGGCNSVPTVFTDAQCGDTFCGTTWADGGTRDTDWYLITISGGTLSASVTSAGPTTLFIVDGIGTCAPVVVGAIGCGDACSPIADASADLPAGEYVVFVAPGDCAGGGIFDGYPCGTSNDYVVTITCDAAVVGACCLPDGSCVDGIGQAECEDEPSSADCGNCNVPHDGLGCSDAACEAIVCGLDSFCCDVGWDQICADSAELNCDCGSGPGGLGGEFFEGLTCDDDPCGPPPPPTGGCCQCDGGDQFCTVEAEDDCAALGGAYLGDDAACEAGGGVQTFTSNPNVAIPDSPGSVSDTIVVDSSATILDLEVSVNVTHTWVGDLCVTLSKDGGPPVTIIQRMDDPSLGCDGGCCACSLNNFNVTLDDEAASAIGAQCQTNLTGTFIPQNSLAGFIGGDTAGAWTLTVDDNAGGDTGTLNSWSLHFTSPAAGESPCEDAFPDQCVTNLPPDCSGATASVDQLWPPNHTFRNVSINGVTDPDGDPVTITITGIFQDESVNGLGDGNTCPDGQGVGTSTAQVRAERSGLLDGRVYTIFFLAEDGLGGECEGSVTVCVPHSQGQGSDCVDQGPNVDSTDCGGAAISTRWDPPMGGFGIPNNSE